MGKYKERRKINHKMNRVVYDALKKRDVRFLAKQLFDFELTPTQEKIVRWIAFSEYKRINISACTRFGKTQMVAIGIALYIILNPKMKRIAFIAPNSEQAKIIRDYLASLIVYCPILFDLAELDSSEDKTPKLVREASRQRQTFKNGCEYRVFSAHGDATRLMGFGASVIVCVTGDTQIFTNKGEKSIKELQNVKNIKILSFNTFSKKQEYQPLEKFYKSFSNNILEIQLFDGRSLKITPNHPVYTKRGWIKAGNLKENEEMLSL